MTIIYPLLFSSLGDCQEVNDMDMGGPGPADGVEEALAL